MTSIFARYSEVVDGILSGCNGVQGIRFLRNRCLVDMIAEIVPGLGFYLLLPGVGGLFWDRIVFVLLCAVVYFLGGISRVDARWHSIIVSALFYLCGLH